MICKVKGRINQHSTGHIKEGGRDPSFYPLVERGNEVKIKLFYTRFIGIKDFR
jgi:hypothetical protein